MVQVVLSSFSRGDLARASAETGHRLSTSYCEGASQYSASDFWIFAVLQRNIVSTWSLYHLEMLSLKKCAFTCTLYLVFVLVYLFFLIQGLFETLLTNDTSFLLYQPCCCCPCWQPALWKLPYEIWNATVQGEMVALFSMPLSQKPVDGQSHESSLHEKYNTPRRASMIDARRANCLSDKHILQTLT